MKQEAALMLEIPKEFRIDIQSDCSLEFISFQVFTHLSLDLI